jgi:hypothetical protein
LLIDSLETLTKKKPYLDTYIHQKKQKTESGSDLSHFFDEEDALPSVQD